MGNKQGVGIMPFRTTINDRFLHFLLEHKIPMVPHLLPTEDKVILEVILPPNIERALPILMSAFQHLPYSWLRITLEKLAMNEPCERELSMLKQAIDSGHTATIFLIAPPFTEEALSDFLNADVILTEDITSPSEHYISLAIGGTFLTHIMSHIRAIIQRLLALFTEETIIKEYWDWRVYFIRSKIVEYIIHLMLHSHQEELKQYEQFFGKMSKGEIIAWAINRELSA